MKIKILTAIITLTSLSSFTKYESASGYSAVTEIQSSEGEALIKKEDCATCHKIDKKVVGPSYLDIAKKYPMNDKNIKYLSEKITKGGSGVWGAVPMSAHTAMKKDDAKKIATYILSLKK
ncbi:c-type cytochrome [Flavobacterium sp. LC2016-12]|uniref:c-type cytochrome n=1 Tax=Flavobacterium sp. LC2016-12 TaxID=2783794 RepID=UPI00188C3EAD|nr:c-type cytochrome [Flavobacterium sp. LC2016-12]MBF4464993.1 c-type cytochrome [Flavobacterium sp. LC2016-12]